MGFAETASHALSDSHIFRELSGKDVRWADSASETKREDHAYSSPRSVSQYLSKIAELDCSVCRNSSPKAIDGFHL